MSPLAGESRHSVAMSWFDPPEPLLPEVIALNGRWQAGKAAVVDGDLVLSWGEFAGATARIAHGLAALGIAPRERIAVLMDSRAETVITLFGIMRAGCVAVPLNVSISDQAVAAMCGDAGVVAVFASGSHCTRIDRLRAAGIITARHFVGCDAPADGWIELSAFCAAQRSDAPVTAIRPEDECNIIYSSGTTAVPKGIVHTHRCRMQWAYDLAIALRYRSDCVTLCSLGLFSNISWVAMLATLLLGGTIVLMRTFHPRSALEVIAARRVTHGAFVPVQLERMLAFPGRAAYSIDSLDTLMCCGSPLAPDVKRRFPQEFGCQLIELYGLTEGLVTILAPEDLERKLTSVGKPVLGADIRIVGEDDRERAVDEIGEIVGRGRLVMTGYHARDDANREATWIDEAGRPWLRTGDLGRIDADGFLYIVDRKKDMILSGGQNIYPADIEFVMREHPSVAEVAVVGVPNSKWGETPVAVVVTAGGHHFEAETLLGWTNARVGKQQRISGVVRRDELPRNPNGKVLKRTLRDELADWALKGLP